MNRKLLSALCLIAGLFCLAVLAGLKTAPVQAADIVISDGVDLFTEQEEKELDAYAREISDQFDSNVIILTTNEYGFSDNYARDVIESQGVSRFPEGYIAFAVDMADRSYWVDVYGDRLRGMFSQSRTDDMADSAADHLRDGEYYEAAAGFLEDVDRRLQVETDPMGWLKKPFIYWEKTALALGLSLVGGLAAAFGMTALKLNKHKDKVLAYNASGYGSSLNLTHNHDRFVSHYQTRVHKPKSSGGSGGGGSAGHTGSGGHF